MRIHVGILTHNAVSLGRADLLDQTVHSAMAAFPDSQILVFDNWSTDGSWDHLLELRRQLGVYIATHVPVDCNHTPGRGVDLMIRHLLGHADAYGSVLVCSDDDMFWKPGAADKITAFWKEPATNVMLLGGLLEPVWHWNRPRFVFEHGGVLALVRDSTPAAAWTFPAQYADRFLPLEPTWKFDTALCRKIKQNGGVVAQMDLADHMGADKSTQHNDAARSGVPLDREKWGV